MRAAQIVAPGKVEVREVAMPVPAEQEVRVRIEGCGVCGSNSALWHGMPWLHYPLAPGEGGHEAWGCIDALGPGVAGVHVGQRVTMLSYRAFAEYDIARVDDIVVLPAQLSDALVPGEALGCAYNVYQRMGVRAGDAVAIVGIGFLGAVVTALCARAGAKVVAISRRAFALEMAHAMGASECIVMDDHRTVRERIDALTDRRGCSHVVEATGQQWPLDLAAEITQVRGRLIIAGYHQDGPRQVNMQLWNWRGLDVINAHERDPATYCDGMRRAVAAVASGRLAPDPLYTHRFPLERLGDALHSLSERPAGFMKAVVLP